MAIEAIGTAIGNTVANGVLRAGEAGKEVSAQAVYAAKYTLLHSQVENTMRRIAKDAVHHFVSQCNIEESDRRHNLGQPFRNIKIDLNSELKEGLIDRVYFAVKNSDVMAFVNTSLKETRCHTCIGNALKDNIPLTVSVAHGYLANYEEWTTRFNPGLADALLKACQSVKKLLTYYDLCLRYPERREEEMLRLLRSGVKDGNDQIWKLGIVAELARAFEDERIVNLNIGDGSQWYLLFTSSFFHTGFRAIHWAACYGNIAAIKLLATISGFEPNAQNSCGNSALNTAIFRLRDKPDLAVETVQALLDARVDPNGVIRRDANGHPTVKTDSSPLHYAIFYSENKPERFDALRRIVIALIKKGADPHCTDKDSGKTAIQYAIDNNAPQDIIDILHPPELDPLSFGF
jgi:hypothetical protein